MREGLLQRSGNAASTVSHKTMSEMITVDPDEASRITGRDKSTLSELHRSGSGPIACLLYTSPSPRDQRGSRMPSSA